MARRSSIEKYPKVEEEQVKPSVKVSDSSVSRKLKLKYPVRYIYRSEATGERYEWSGAGSIVSVVLEDALILLTKTRKGGCCGASPQDNFLFEEVN